MHKAYIKAQNGRQQASLKFPQIAQKRKYTICILSESHYSYLPTKVLSQYFTISFPGQST